MIDISIFMDHFIQEVITGLLLGDAHLEKHGSYARLSLMRATKDIDYLIWTRDVLNDFCKQNVVSNSRLDSRTKKIYFYSYFKTRSLPIFLSIYNKWYLNKKKVIDQSIKITPLVMGI